MGIKGTIDSAFSFKKSAIGIADVGRDYFSQAIEIISCCRKIDIENRPDLVPKLNEIYIAAQDALEAAKNNKKPKLSPGEINAAFEKVWDLLKEPDLNLEVEEIQKLQDSVREKDAKTKARFVPIMKQHEIKKANPPGKDVKLDLIIGATKLTGPQLWIATEPFGNNHTLNIVLWVLIQSGKVKMNQNPHFYSSGLLDPATFDRHFKTDPLSFNKKLGTKDVRVLHVLVDASSRLVLQSQDPSFYRNFGNIWLPSEFKEPVRIVKHFDGTLEATNRIDLQISESRLALKLISGSASTPQAAENIWDDYLMSVPRNIVGQVTFQHGKLLADNYGEISGEDTEPQERQDSSEDDVEEEQIPVAPPMQTRSRKAKETQEADEQARAKEKARLGAEKEEREAKVARDARLRDEAKRRNREAQDEKRRMEDQQRAEAKLAAEARLRDEAERRAREAQEEKRRIEDQQRAALEAEQRAKTAQAAQERSDSEKRNREAKEAARVEREQQENRNKEAEEKAAAKKPKLGWMRRTINYVAGSK